MAKIPDLPSDERPRERLARLGAHTLSDAELLGIFLRTGVKGKSAVEVGRELLKKYGSFTALGALSAEELSGEHGLGIAKAAQLKAAFELAARCTEEKMHDKALDNAQEIYDMMFPRLAHLRKECVVLLLLDKKLRCIRQIELSHGEEDFAFCSPKEICRHAILGKSSTLILVHNHPSGDPSPSKNDISLTKRIDQATKLMGIRFIDHIIIGKGTKNSSKKAYYSFAENGRL